MARRLTSALLSALIVSGSVALSVPAEAHTLAPGGSGFLAGLAHPLAGWDHVLAMVAVGVWASRIGRPARWMLPVLFPLAVAGGGLLAWSGVPMPAVEAGIGASVLVLGLLIGLALRPGLRVSIPLVALFAVFHGHAHGTELGAASPVLYGLGFVLATLAMHLIGLAIGHAAMLPGRTVVLRLGGAAIALAGVFLLVG